MKIKTRHGLAIITTISTLTLVSSVLSVLIKTPIPIFVSCLLLLFAVLFVQDEGLSSYYP